MTTDGFTQMIDDSNAFFAELKENNNKWQARGAACCMACSVDQWPKRR